MVPSPRTQVSAQKHGANLGRRAGAVSKKTDYVVAGVEAGSKLDKARVGRGSDRGEGDGKVGARVRCRCLAFR